MRLNYDKEEVDDAYEQRIIREYWKQKDDKKKIQKEEEKKSGYYQKDDTDQILQYRAQKIRQSFIDNDRLEAQQKIEIEGVQIVFPYPPYESQVEYMTRVIRALNHGNYAALESPTGTGKTLCLLTACLAWIYHKQVSEPEFQPPQLIYSSRTHSQLNQVKKELQKTIYKPRCTTVASRDNLCVNAEIKQQYHLQGEELSKQCLANRSDCGFYKNFNERNRDTGVFWGPLDIEDLCKKGKEIHICPYYLEKDRIQEADLLFLPYVYLIDQNIKSLFKLDPQNSIIIIDEGHNIAQQAEQCQSLEITGKDIMLVYKDLLTIESKINELKERRWESDLQCIRYLNSTQEHFENVREAIANIKRYILNPDKFQVKGFELNTSQIEIVCEKKMRIFSEISMINLIGDPQTLSNSMNIILQDSCKW